MPAELASPVLCPGIGNDHSVTTLLAGWLSWSVQKGKYHKNMKNESTDDRGQSFAFVSLVLADFLAASSSACKMLIFHYEKNNNVDEQVPRTRTAPEKP